jgi:hypothetical protein
MDRFRKQGATAAGTIFSMSERLELSHSIASNPGIACLAASMAFVLISVLNTVAPADENARSNFEPHTRCCRSNENLLIHDALQRALTSNSRPNSGFLSPVEVVPLRAADASHGIWP